MKVGLFLSAHCEPGDDPSRRLEQILEQALAAEELGFHSVHLGHHYLTQSAFLQPISMAAHIAALTKRIRIGFGIYLLPLLNPLAIAEEFATLDVLSAGRITAGFGVGYRKKEYRAFGVPFEERFRRFDQSIEIIRALWRGEEVTAEGSFGSLDGAKVHLRPVQPGGPPILLGAFTPRGIRRIAEHDAVWLAPPDGDDEALGERFRQLRTELGERGLSLDRDYPLTREGYIATTRGRAMEKAKDYVLKAYENYRSWDTAQGIDPESFLEDQALICDPEGAIERLTNWERRLGVTEVNLRMEWAGMPHADAMEAIQTVGQHVIPGLDGGSDS